MRSRAMVIHCRETDLWVPECPVATGATGTIQNSLNAKIHLQCVLAPPVANIISSFPTSPLCVVLVSIMSNILS